LAETTSIRSQSGLCRLSGPIRRHLGIHGGHPADKLILPDPTKPAVLEQLFHITDIQLDEDEALTLGATCTWDDEHGLCIRIEDGKVTGVGQRGDF
jgi:hypothetical protein